MENRIARKILAAGVAVFYSATNVLFCHSAESAFWSARREAARKINKNGGESASASRSAGPTDALVLAQLPGGMRFDVHSPAPAYVTPVPAKEHLVGGKVPVFSSDLPRWLGDVVTPYGNIRDVHLSKRPGAPLVIHIQDLHDSSEAQRNIAGLVEALQDERGVSLVGLEGAQGAFATEAFRSFPDAEITKAVATYFMEEGYLGGPEFAGITAKRVPLLWGVEDMAGYNANVTAVKESAQNRPAVELFLREARTLLNEIKTRRLSPALLEFDRNFSAYQSRKMPLGAYVRYLLKSSPSGSARAPNLVLLRDALTWEDSLDFPRIERERASLLEQMVRVLPNQQLKTLVDKSALYRLGRISYGDYYRFFRTLCEENGIPLTDYRQLHAYVRYVLLAERINRNDLLNELTALELSVQDQLISRPKERRVVNAARHLGQLERLVRHSYTPADWGYHILHEEQIRNVGLTVRALAKEEGLPETLSPPSVEMLKPFENFCLQALGRNGAMVGNLLEKMAAEKRPSAVLVAGGFHTDGMTQLFRQKDVSYVVVTPKVNGELPDGHRTLDILARDPAPLEKLFAGETVNIPTPGMTNGQNAVSNPLARKFATLFVVISLGLTALTTGESVNTPTTPALPNVLTANAVPDQRGAVVTVGQKGNQQPFAVRYVSDGQPSVGFRATVPGYGEVDVSPASQGGGWRGFLSFLIAGIGGVRKSLQSQAVTPVHSGAATGDATKQPKATSTVQLSDIGLLLLPLEELADGLPAEGISKQQLTAGVSEKTRLPNVSDDVRQRIVANITEGFAGDTIVTREGIRNLVAQLRSSKVSGNYTADLLHNLRWLDRFRVSLPRLYYLFVGAWETYAFLFLALPSLSALLLGSGFVPPLIAGCGTILMAVGVFWIFHPIFRWLLGGRPRTFSVLVAELRLEWNLAKMHFFISRLFGAIVFASIFVSVSALPVANSDMLAWVVTALVHSVWDIKMAGLRLGDPIDLQFVGRLRAWRAILLGRADKLWLVRLDGDNISLKNMRFDPLTGVLPGERASSDLIYESDSLFLEFKEITRQFFVEEGAYVSRGEGGDEFEVVIEGSKEQVEMALNRVRQRISSYFFDGPHAPVFVELRSILKREELIGNLKKVGGLAGVAVHGDNYLVRYKKDKNGTSRSVEEIVHQINGIAGTSGSVVPYNDTDVHDVGFFTISMGAVNANEVADALGRNGNKVSRAQANQLVTWGFRWANAALKTAKDEGRNRVHLATVDDIQSFKKERKKNGDEPKPTPGLFEWLKNSFTRPSNDDLIPGALTMPQLRARLKRTPWGHLTMVTVAGYLGTVSPRAFHTLQEREGMTHADGNGVIVKIFNSLKTTLPTTSDVARKRPDTFFVVSDSPPNAAQSVQSELSGFKPIKSIELVPLVINFNLSFDVFSRARSLALPNGTLKNSLNANLPDVFMGKIGDMIHKKLALAAESNREGIENLVRETGIETWVDVVVSGSSVEIIVSSQKLVDLALEFEKHIALERKKAGDELMRLSREKTNQLNEGREKDQTPVVKDRLNNRVVDAMEFIGKDRKKAQSVVGNKWFQTLAMPFIELPLMPVLSVALAWALVPMTGQVLPILLSSVVLAYWHGRPVSTRAPPERLPANLQTWGQFLVRLGFAMIINFVALWAGGVPLESLIQAQSFDVSSIDYVRLISYAYSFHAAYNFLVPEQYRLSVFNRGTETEPEKGIPAREIHRLTPLDFVDNMSLVERRYNRLREAYQSDHKLKSEGLTEKIERISQFNFRDPVGNRHQADDYFNMVVGMCSLEDGTQNLSPDSNLLRLVLYERAVRLIELANKVKKGIDLSESEKKEIRWVIYIFSPLAAAVPEESNDFFFGMDIAAVLTDLTFYINNPKDYLAKREELLNYYANLNGGHKGEDWLFETKENIGDAIQDNLTGEEYYELRIKTVASTLVKGRDKRQYEKVGNLKDLITGTIVVPLKEGKDLLDWDRGVLARISKIIRTLKSIDPTSGVLPLTPEELSNGEKNPDKKAEGYYHVNLVFKGFAFELQFKTPERYVTQKVGSRGSEAGTMAHYVHKWHNFLNHLSSFLFPKKMELRAHRTPFVGEFKADFNAFWKRARRYTIVTPLDDNDLKDPNKPVDVMRLPRGATTADFMAHSWVDPEFTMTSYSPAYLVRPDSSVSEKALPLTDPLAMGAQITVRGPPVQLSDPRLRLEIVDTSKTFRLWAKGIEARDAKAYEPAGNDFIEFMGLAKDNRAGRSAVDDDLNQFLLKHDINFETLVLLIGEEIVTERPFGDIAQQGVVGRLVRHFADKGLKENKSLVEQQRHPDYKTLLEKVESPLKDHLLVLSKYLDGIDEFGKMEPEKRAYLIGLGLWNVGKSPSAQGNPTPMNALAALPLLDPTGFGWVSVLGIGVVLGFFFPSLKNSILDGLRKMKPFGLRLALVGLSLMVLSGGALGADGVVAMGALDGLSLFSLVGVAGAAVLGIKPVTSKDAETGRVIRGGDNKVKRVEFGVAMLYTPLHSDGDIVPYVSYSLRNPGDNDGLVSNRVKAEQRRIKEVAKRINDRKDVNKKQIIEKIVSRIRTAEINAQTAVVDTIDDMSVRADAGQRAVLNEVKDELLRALLDNHSISHLGYSQEELARLKEGEVNKVLKAFEQVSGSVEDRKNRAVGDEGAIVEVREGAEVELAQLAEIKEGIIDTINQQNTTALGALIVKFREIEGFLLEAGTDLDTKIKENFTQAIGNVLNAIEIVQERLAPQQISLEVARFEKALQSARSKATKVNRKSFDVLNTKVSETIRQGWKAEAALSRVDGNLPQDVVLALMDELTAPPQEASGKGVIVFSQEVLTPNDMARLKQRGVRVVGIVTAGGNSGSHAAIVAQSLSIPFVTGATVSGTEAGADWAEIVTPGLFVGLDGSTGEVFVNPSDEQIRNLEGQQQKLVVSEAVFESEERENTPLPVKASPDDRDQLAQVKDPVGLIRTEYLFNHPTLSPLLDGDPNIAFEDYLVDEFERSARLNDQQVDIRVIDNQGQEDKPLSGVPQQVGGHTGIEFLLRDPDGRKIALQEIRAIIRAYQGHRNIRMFFPLVSTLEDAENIQALVQEAVQSLPKKGSGEWDVPPLGYMIETPAGVINSGLLANRATFFNIGSTDLTRATFNMTRNTPTLGAYLSTNRPEVTSQIMTVLRSAKAGKIEVTLCGALASSRLFWPVALALQTTHPLGISVPPPLIPEAKYYLRRLADQKEALGELNRLLGDPKTSADQLTQAAQAMVDIVERGIPDEESYKKAMESLAEKKRRELMLKAFLGVVSVLIVGVVVAGLLMPGATEVQKMVMESAIGPWASLFGGRAEKISTLILAGSGAVWGSLKMLNFENAANNSINGKYARAVILDLKGIKKNSLELTENDVIVVRGQGPSARVFQSRGNDSTLKCEINEITIDRWNGFDNSAMGSSGSKNSRFIGYTRTQLHTAVLAAMAQYIMGKSGAANIDEAIANVRLTEEAVHKLFLEGAKSEAIRELQNNRFVTLLFTSWAIKISDILPIGAPGQLEAEITGMTFDRNVSGNRDGFAALAKFDLGDRDANIELGKDLWDLAKDFAPSPTAEFRPNGLAMALNNFASENGVTAKEMKNQLAVTMLSRIDAWKNNLTDNKLLELWGALALLFGLNGNLSEGRTKDEGLREALRKVRGHLQNLDLTFLVNLAHTTGMEMNNGTDLTEKGFGQFNRVAQQAFSLRDPHQAITESFEKGEDILIYVSPRMAKGLKNDLTPAEQTQIEMLTLLSKRLVDEEDLEAVEWLAKKKRIIFAVVGTKDQVAEMEVLPKSLLPALIRAGAEVGGLNRKAGLGEISLGFTKFMPVDGETPVSAKDEFNKLNIAQVSLLALDVEGVTVDYSGVKDKIVSFILALAGGLMTQVAPGIVESLKKQQAVKRSA